MDRTQLFDSLSNLPPAAFERLLFAVNMPRMNRAGASAKIGDQVSALWEWADSSIGPGLEAIARHLAKLNRFEFEAYLRSLVATYEKWWTHYTLTDATGKLEQPQPEQPSVFDFRLMVQTVAKEKDAPGPELRAEEREKTERLPVLDGIRKYADDHVLLVGRPGSGKSTALIKLVLDVADQTLKDGQGQIPILVELRYWQTSVIERIQAFLNRHDPSLSLDDAALNSLLRQGRFLLLIDGLNELPSDEARTQLTTFRRDYPQVPMIFTTRDLGLGGDLGIEKKLEMQPLTEAQMKEFIRAYVPDQAEAMLRQLSDRLREFGQTPLLLWMLCEVFQQSPNRQMPTNLAEVFRAFTTMYEDSSVRKHEVALLKGDVRPLSDRRLWKDALKALAALMMQGETPVDFRVAIHRTEAERELGKLFANEKFPVRDILDDLLKYHLLQNRTTDQLEFRHQLIQEYYAAEHLRDLLPDLLKDEDKFKRDYLNFLKWTEPIALMLSLVDDEAQVLWMVRLTLNHVDLMLGARLAGKVLPKFQQQTINQIDNLKIPCQLKIILLGETRSEAALEKISNAANNKDHDSQALVFESLEKVDKNFNKVLTIEILDKLHKQNPYIANKVIDTFRQKNVNRCIQSIARKPDRFGPIVRQGVAAALGNSDDDVKINVLGNFLCDNSSSIRLEAVRSLRRVSPKKMANLLQQVLTDKDESVKYEAISALVEAGNEKAFETLVQGLNSEDYMTCWRSAVSLGSIAKEETNKLLFQALENGSTRQRICSACGLGLSRQAIAVKPLIKALNDPVAEVIESAARALATIKNKSSIKYLIECATKNKNYQSHKACVDAVNVIIFLDTSSARLPTIDRKCTEELNNLLEESLSELNVFDFYGDKELRDREIERSCGLIGILGFFGNCRTIRMLLSALENDCPNIRKNAVVALGEIGDKAVVKALIKCLKDEDWRVREGSCDSLRKIVDDSTTNYLIPLLCDDDFNVRSRASDALGECGSPNLLSTLWRSQRLGEESHFVTAITAIQNRCKFYNYEIFHDILIEGETVSLYFSYAPADEALQAQLKYHLALLERQGIITSWSSHQILPGDDRTQTIHQQLNTADIILLLISPDAIADDTCYHFEIQRAMERHQSGEARVIPILLRPVDWQGAPFSQLNVLPKNHQPVTTWPNQDVAFQDIAEGIRTVAMELRKTQ